MSGVLDKQKKAKKRADHWVDKLFAKATDTNPNSHFTEIMDAVENSPEPDLVAFTLACHNANLEETEIKWLWNYLKHCDAALYNGIPEKATSGW